MSEPKLLNDRCPLCGGKLRVKKGMFFTYTGCKKCGSNAVITGEHTFKRYVFENGVRYLGKTYFHDSLLKYRGQIVTIKVNESSIDIYDKRGQIICVGLPPDTILRIAIATYEASNTIISRPHGEEIL